jgi:hypothetical protein
VVGRELRLRLRRSLAAAAVFAFIAAPAAAQPLSESDPLARPIALVVAGSLVGLLPFAVMMLTSFV